MSDLVWTTAICPQCGAVVPIGIMSLAATCACGAYYVDVQPPHGGWYRSRAAYERGEARLQ